MPRKNRFASCIATGLLLLIAASLPACSMLSAKPGDVPTVPCEQPPASLTPLFPSGDECKGTEQQRRDCYSLQVALWANQMLGLYTGEVQKRATQDGCLAKLRKAGVIR